MASDPPSWLNKAVDVCFTILLGAAALFIAVKLIMAVWTTLLVILGIGLVGLICLTVIRARSTRW
ncbi:MAG TPA: hypothetical protein VHO01_07935 [Jatrophihabitans sp.]|nr:hypothetical protein [Jatrophihabitans sp.]